MIPSDLPEWVRELSIRDLGLGWLTLRSPEPLPAIKAAAAGGFGSVGLKFTPRPGEPAVALTDDPAFRREVRRSLGQHGVSLCNIGSLWLDGERDPAMFLPALQAGAELGGHRAIGISIDPEPARRTDHLGRLATLCADHGMELAIEFFAYSAIPSLGDALSIVEELRMDNLTILLDALHFARSGGTPAQIAALPPQRIGWFQLCDGPAQHPGMEGLSFEGGKSRLDPGEGGLPLGDYLPALPPGTLIEVEIPRLASAELTASGRAVEVAERVRQFLQLKKGALA